jgi:small subunit ribosomal protein S17
MAENEETTPPEDTSPAEADAPEEAAAEPEEPEAAAEPEAPAEPVAPDHPKERRRRARAEKAAGQPARAAMTPEERQAERLAERSRKSELRRKGRLRAREKAQARKGETRETPAREHAPGKQKTRQGVVVSNRASKTISVRIDTTGRHRRYEKIVRTSRTVHAHDEREEAGIGDTVILQESRPLSRSKRWRLIEVVGRAK